MQAGQVARLLEPCLLILLLVEVIRRHGEVAEWRPGALVIGGVGLILIAVSVATGRWLAALLALCLTAAAYGLWRLLRRAGDTGRDADAPDTATPFALLLLIVGLALTFFVEFFYLRDSFNNRMNTIFKFYFQAWILWSLGGAWQLARWLQRPVRAPGGRRLLVGASALLIALGMLYTVLAVPARAREMGVPWTLDGAAWLKAYAPGDHAAIEWLNTYVEGSPVILEAPGDRRRAYVYEGRISALTGLPTLLGWGGHELQWRGTYDEPGRREPLIETVYRNLEILSEIGMIQKLEMAGTQKRFDGTVENHYHVRCIRCGRVDDVLVDSIPTINDALAEANDYEILWHRLEFVGLCPQCKKESGPTREREVPRIGIPDRPMSNVG